VKTVRKLVRAGFLIIEGTRSAIEDERFATDWEWDLRAGMFHLSTKDSAVMTEEQELEYLGDLIETNEPIDLYLKNDPAKPIVTLERPKLADRGLELLAKRRTRRFFDAKPITTEQLGDCLYAGLGITGFVLDAIPKYGKLPLKLTRASRSRCRRRFSAVRNGTTARPRSCSSPPGSSAASGSTSTRWSIAPS
jgi:hypothetical protein